MTKEERIIKELANLSKNWSPSLWLFSGNGHLYIMKKDKNNKKVYTSSGGVDPTYIVTEIYIDNDGGDW